MLRSLFGACFCCSHVSSRAVKGVAVVQVHCKVSVDLLCSLCRAVVVWRHLPPSPRPPHPAPSESHPGHPAHTWTWSSIGRCKQNKIWGFRNKS